MLWECHAPFALFRPLMHISKNEWDHCCCCNMQIVSHIYDMSADCGCHHFLSDWNKHTRSDSKWHACAYIGQHVWSNWGYYTQPYRQHLAWSDLEHHSQSEQRQHTGTQCRIPAVSECGHHDQSNLEQYVQSDVKHIL